MRTLPVGRKSSSSLSRRATRSSITNPDRWLWDALAGGETAAGRNVTEKTAMSIPAFFCGVTVIARTVASLPRFVYERQARGRTVADAHPLYRVIHSEPNPEMSAYTMFESLMTDLLIYGNAYAAKVYDYDSGGLAALYPVSATRVMVARERGASTVFYDVRGDDGAMTRMPAEMMFHLRTAGDGIVGRAVLTRARESLGLSIAAERYGASYFGNNAKPSMILTHPGVLTDEAARRLRDSWSTSYGGPRQLSTAVLEEGMQATPVSIANNDAQFLETRKHQVVDCARWLNISPAKLHDHTHSTFSNIEHLDIEFAKHTIRPLCVLIEQEISRSLLRLEERSRYYAEHQIDGLLRGDYASRWSAYQTARNSGIMSANEIRELENMNPQAGDDGDMYFIQGAMISTTAAAQGPPGRSASLPDSRAAIEILARDTASRMLAIEQAELARAERREAEPREMGAILDKQERRWADALVAVVAAADAMGALAPGVRAGAIAAALVAESREALASGRRGIQDVEQAATRIVATIRGEI